MSVIVVGVDGSPNSQAAAKWAADQGHHTDATATAAHRRSGLTGR